jgi:hypothetical protein
MIRMFKGQEIRSVGNWFTHAPPKEGKKQWVDGRSAKELAKAWFPSNGVPCIPDELQALLDSRSETCGIVFDRGEPERVIHFDTCGGEGRNADLVLWGHGPCGNALASIEAKADEPFGEIAGEYVRKASARNPRSRVPQRFDLLCQGVLGMSPADPAARALRYQLLTAVAGAMADAQRCEAGTVLMIVHEFVGAVDPEKLRTNADDLNRFVRTLSQERTQSVCPGVMAGPFAVPGNAHFAGTDSLFIGKCRR